MSSMIEDGEEEELDVGTAVEAIAPKPKPKPKTEAPRSGAWTQKEVDRLRLHVASRIAAAMIPNASNTNDAIAVRAAELSGLLVRIIILKKKHNVAVLGSHAQIGIEQRGRGGISVE